MDLRLAVLPLLMFIESVICQGYPADRRGIRTSSMRSFGSGVGSSFGGQRSGLGGQASFSSTQFRQPRRGADFFNQNLQLDTIAPRVGLGGSVRSRGFGSQLGGGIQEDQHIRRIIGSTVAGRELRMGEIGLPRHGGAGIGERHANGMLNGWDGNPQTLTTQFQDSWSDPFQGGPVPHIPLGFQGDFSSIFRGSGMRGPRRPFWGR